jgi:cbb3-type cytochrome oxidase subunit 3
LGNANKGFFNSTKSLTQIVGGKMFIRSYPFALAFSSSSNEVTIAITGPGDNSDFILDIVLICTTIFFLFTFVFCMSRKRRARYEKERKMFFKLKELQEEDPHITVEMFRLK